MGVGMRIELMTFRSVFSSIDLMHYHCANLRIKTDYGSVGPSALERRWAERRKRLD